MATVREITNARRARRAAEKAGGSVPETAITNVIVEPVAEAVDVCPTCGKSGDEACVTASGNVKSEWHSKRGN